MKTPQPPATPLAAAKAAVASTAAVQPGITPQSVTRDYFKRRLAQLDQEIGATAVRLTQMQQQLAAFQGARAEITDALRQLDTPPAPATDPAAALATPAPPTA